MARKPLITPGSILPSSPPDAESPTPDLLSRVIAADRAKRQINYPESASSLESKIASNLENKESIEADENNDSKIDSYHPINVEGYQSIIQESYTDSNIETNQSTIRDSKNDSIIAQRAETLSDNDPLVQINTRIPASVARGIKIQAIKEGQTTQALISEILMSYLERVGVR